MSVYVEVVILNNFALDLLLVLSALYVRRRPVRKMRVLLAVILGTAVATAFPLLDNVWQITIKALLSFVLAAVFDKYKGFKDYIISLGIFAALTFALGGVISGLGYLMGIDLNSYAILGLTALGAVLGMVGLRAILHKRQRASVRISRINTVIDGVETAAEALYDTGNTLVDDLTGLPVVILSARLEEQLRANLSEKLKSDDKKPDEPDANQKNRCDLEIEGYIEVRTVGGQTLMPIIKTDVITVDGKDIKAYAALSKMNYEGYDIILQNSMF